MRRLKWIGIALAALLVVVMASATWLLASNGGARFALARIVSATDGKLSYESSNGTLASPLVLKGVRYVDPDAGVDARIRRLELKASLGRLLSRRVQIDGLSLEGIDVAMTTVPPKPSEPSDPLSLDPPIDIALDQLIVREARITQDGETVFVADTLDAAAAWTREGIALRQLALRSPQGSVDVNGTLTTIKGYGGNGHSVFDWEVGGSRYAGTLDVESDGKQATLGLALSQPMPATIAGTLGQQDRLPWTLKLDVPAFDARRLIPGTELKSLATTLQGSGDIENGTLTGEVVVDGHRVLLDPLRYALANDVLRIDALALRSPQAAGVVEATGSVQLKAQPVAADFSLHWRDVVVPADLAGQELASHGQLSASGSAEAYRAEAALSVGPPGKLSDITVKLAGTPEQVLLESLALKQRNGGLDASGTIKLAPVVSWDMTAKARRFDPGAFAAEWPGAIDLDLATTGTLGDNGPDARIRIDNVGGTLRQRALSGRGDVTIKPEFIVDGVVALKSGQSRIDVEGRGGNQTDATIRLAIGSLTDWLPDSGGKLDGQFRVSGRWPALNVDGTASGSTLRLGDTRIASLDFAAAIRNIDAPSGTIDVKAGGVNAGSASYESLTLQGSGSQASHQITLQADGIPASVALQLSGSSQQSRWNGTLKQLSLQAPEVPRFDLATPVQLAWNGQRFSASEACLAGDSATLCVEGSGGADGSVDAKYRIVELPLALLAKLGAPDAPMRIEGHLEGSGAMRRSAAGALSGQATIRSPSGRIDWIGADGAEPRPMLAFTGFAIDAALSPSQTTATVNARLDNNGAIDGRVAISGPLDGNPALSGQLKATLNSLKFVELFTSELANVQGRVEADYGIGGTLDQPALTGSLQLRDFATEVPMAGLKLRDGDIRVRAAEADRFVIEGRIVSGNGMLNVGGEGGFASDAPLRVTIQGDGVMAVDIPAAKVVVSPDLAIVRDSSGLLVTGKVEVPNADVDLTKLPGGSAVSSTSADVVIVDEPMMEAGKALPVTSRVTVVLGDKVRIVGYGFNGDVKGQLSINDIPGRATVATGTLNVGGTYRAYGQDLQIEAGRILFAGTQVDNPGLDIRAVRKIREDDITAGLNVRGTAQMPVLTVFSNPVMEQSEALSYLLTGKPLSALNSGEGDMLGSAARALGTAGGDLLAKNIGSKLGVDDIGVSDNAVLGGAAFTVGKYLSPKLYLSYGVGIFEPGEVITLRYIFNPRWNFETQNATTGSRAGINYRYER